MDNNEKPKTKLCKKPGRDTFKAMSKEERLAIHRARIVAKRRRDHAVYLHTQANPAIIRPNLSRKHPNRNQPIHRAYSGTS